MSIVENDDDNELDIYSNLPNFHYDDSLQKLEGKNKLLLEKVCALQKQITSLRKEFLICKQEKEQLAKNISSLYKSAKQEILRKDRQIGELSARNILLEQRTRNEKTIVSDSRNEDFSHHRIDRSVCSSEKVKKPNNENDSTPTTHRYGTRSKSIKKLVDEVEKKHKESKSVDLRKKKNVQKHDAPCISRSNKDKSKSNIAGKAVSHSVRDSASPERLIIVENNLTHESNVEINDGENNLESKVISDDTHPVEIASPVVPSLPPFVGPKTTFSVRKYKQLYGVSPFKRAKLALTGNNSLCSGPLKQAVPKNLFCDNKGTKVVTEDKISDSLSGVTVVIPESSNKTDKSVIFQLSESNVKQKYVNDSSSISKEDLTSEKNLQKLKTKVSPVEYDFSFRKENIERITSKIKQNNYENSYLDFEPFYLNTESYKKLHSSCKVETSISGNELDRSIVQTSEKLVNNCQYKESLPTSKRRKISRGNSPQVIISDKYHDDSFKNKLIKVTAQVHADKDGGRKKEVCSVVSESTISVEKISLIDKVTSNSVHVDKILSQTEKEIDVVEKDKSAFTIMDKTKESCIKENGVNEKIKNRISDLTTVTRRDGENHGSSTTKGNQIENTKHSVELTCSPDSCESFTLEITNSPEPLMEENTRNDKKLDNISSNKISKNETGAFSEISRTVQTQEEEIKNGISENVSVDLNLKQLSVEKSSDKDCEFLKSSSQEQENKSLKDSIIPVKNVQSLEKHCEDVILSQSENIHLNKSGTKKSVEKNKTDDLFSDILHTAQRDISLLKDLMTPEKKSEMSVNHTADVNLSAPESDSSSSIEEYSISPVKEKDLLLCDSSLKKQASPIKCYKNKYKNKEQQLKDLFGESPLKLDDTSSSCNENTGNNFNLFNSITPILTKIQNKELNKSNNLLNLDLSSRNDDLKITHSKTSDLNNEKRVLITPGVSKSFLDFKEAFQYGKTDGKNLSNDQVISENNFKCVTSPSKSNSLDKENPNHSIGQKLSPISSNIKNVLCDKCQKNNSNITVACVKPNEPIQKKSENLIDIENEKMLRTKFSPGGFGSEVNKKVVETSHIKTDVLKFSECTSLLSCEDSTIHMIKTFSKVGDSVSPIKTPLKLSDVICEQKVGASVGHTLQNTKLCKTNKPEIIHKKTNEGFLKISSNSSLTNNDNSAVHMMRDFSQLNDSIVSPIKTQLKLNDNKKENAQLGQCVITEPVILNDPVKLLTKLTEKILTPMVIKKDGVSVCLSSEHCEFKRKRPIRKNIKFHNLGTVEPIKAKEFEGNTSFNCNERKSENSPVGKATIFDEPESKKQRIICSSLPKDLQSQKEKEVDSIRCDQRKLNLINDSDCQKSGGAIIINKKSEKNFNIIKSNDVVNKMKSPSKQEDHDKFEKQGKDKSKVQKSELNRISNTHSRTVPCDSKNRSFLSPSVCERRSPSEYFNRQHRRRFRRDSFHSRRSNRRLSRLSSPSFSLQKHERKLEMKLRSEETSQRKYKSQSLTCQNYQKSERKSLNRNEVRPKKMDKSSSSSFDVNSATLCFPLKRLSVSPNVKEAPSPVKPVEENHMEWKVVPLHINEKSSNLIGKFVSHKIIPNFIGNLKNKDSVTENKTDDVGQKNCEKQSVAVNKDNNFSKPGPVMFMRRTKRFGETHLEDSKGFSPSISPNKKSVVENKIKPNLTEDDKSTVSNINQEGINKKKQIVQKTRCIVKTPLDFKTQFGDIKVSSDEDDLSISSSSDEDSCYSDESWRPKR